MNLSDFQRLSIYAYPVLEMLNFEGYAQGCTQNGLQFLKPKIMH